MSGCRAQEGCRNERAWLWPLEPREEVTANRGTEAGVTEAALDLNNSEALDILLRASETVARKYRASTPEDLYQSAWEWLLRHPVTVTTALEDGKVGRRRLESIVSEYLTSLARADKASGRILKSNFCLL